MSIPLTLIVAAGLLAPGAPDPEADLGPTAVLKDTRPDPKDQKGNEDFLRGEIDHVRCSDFLRVALKQLDVESIAPLRGRKDPVKWLRANLRVTVQPEAGTLSVSLPGFHPNDQIPVVNAVVEAYLEEEVRERRERYGRALKFTESSRESMWRELQERLRTPPERRDAIDRRRIEILKDDLEGADKTIKEIRRVVEPPPRLQWHERPRGRQ